MLAALNMTSSYYPSASTFNLVKQGFGAGFTFGADAHLAVNQESEIKRLNVVASSADSGMVVVFKPVCRAVVVVDKDKRRLGTGYAGFDDLLLAFHQIAPAMMLL